MKLLTVLAATAVAAAVAAALSLPAVADRGTGDDASKLTTCLHTHGAADAPTDSFALKRWLATRAGSTAVKACVPEAAAPAELISCLRGHGLNPPDDLFQLKPWMLRQAGNSALKACGVNFDRPQSDASGKDLADCLRSHGADVPAGTLGRALKIWIGDHSGDATVTGAFKRCGADTAPPKASDCGGGGGAVAPVEKAKPTL
jgi:hypothetical protein